VVGQPGDGRPGDHGRAQVRTPDVVTVDQPGHDRLAAQRASGGESFQVARPGDQIEADRLDRRVQQCGQGVAEFTEVGRAEDRRPVPDLAEPGVGAAQRVEASVAEGGGHPVPVDAVCASGAGGGCGGDAGEVLGDGRHRGAVVGAGGEVARGEGQVGQHLSCAGDAGGVSRRWSPRMRVCRSARSPVMVFEGCTRSRSCAGRATRRSG
jgi:hypothetical protein